MLIGSADLEDGSVERREERGFDVILQRLARALWEVLVDDALAFGLPVVVARVKVGGSADVDVAAIITPSGRFGYDGGLDLLGPGLNGTYIPLTCSGFLFSGLRPRCFH